LGSALYQGFTWGSELFVNSERQPFETEVPSADDPDVFETQTLAKRRRSVGGYTYGELKLNRSWSTGFLFDYAPSIESPAKKTKSYSPFITWNLSEFNRLRFQYSYFDDKVREEKSERGHQFFLQWTTVLGSHTHGFRTR
jgi:hypothetical protein